MLDQLLSKQKQADALFLGQLDKTTSKAKQDSHPALRTKRGS